MKLWQFGNHCYSLATPAFQYCLVQQLGKDWTLADMHTLCTCANATSKKLDEL